jgi:homogentisate phytyltransferase / homogentisate geranylgeranyltransferase
MSWLYALWKFSRPHTIVGTSLSVLGLFLMALAASVNSNPLNAWVWPDLTIVTGLLGTWMACLCGNVYIVGLNQLTDVEIDKINKPHLPLAAGDFSSKAGWTLVSVTGVMALLLAGGIGLWLLIMVAVSLGLGTIYSLPPLRLKRFPFWAALCIFTVRGVVVNVGLFLHFQTFFPTIIAIPPFVWALTLFMLGFSFAIALFKDIPDLVGDRYYNINTLTVRWGQTTVFNLARWVLVASYLGMVLAGLLGLPNVNRPVLILSHLLILVMLWWRSTAVNLDDKVAIAQFYQFIWKLFFLEYLVFPITCMLGMT